MISASFADIAKREAQGERHIRLLAPLAFVSPRIIAAIVDGTAPADLTVTGLAALPGAAETPVGADGTVVGEAGVAETWDDGTLSPAAFAAVTM